MCVFRFGDLGHTLACPIAKSTMIDSYWDLYVAYVNKCICDNWNNDIDPHHHEMEWNHYLPKSIFGDWPIGHFLTLRQHAIASALQTLAFKKNCMVGSHKNFLPRELLLLAWPYYHESCTQNGKKTFVLGTGCHTPESRSRGGKIGGKKAAKTNKRNGTGIFDPSIREMSHSKSRKRVSVVNLKTGRVTEFKSIREAAIALDLEYSNLKHVCSGRRKSTGGYAAELIS